MLGNVADLMAEHKHNQGGLSFTRHLRFPVGVYVHKTAALLLYFEARRLAEGTADEGREVAFERVQCPSDSAFADLVRERSAARLAADGSTCTLHADVMEVNPKPKPNPNPHPHPNPSPSPSPNPRRALAAPAAARLSQPARAAHLAAAAAGGGSISPRSPLDLP